MKRFGFLSFVVGSLFFFIGASYFFLAPSTKATAVITGVSAVNIVGSGAQITWVTNVPSNSRVAYVAGTQTSGGSTYALFSESRCDAGGYVTSHCVVLSGLSRVPSIIIKLNLWIRLVSTAILEAFSLLPPSPLLRTPMLSSRLFRQVSLSSLFLPLK